MNIKRLLFLSMNMKEPPAKTYPSIVVVFGRPGAGKTTVAEAALKLLACKKNTPCLGLDLDVCVPQWMKDNFAEGIYPTLKEREDFALDCCDFVEKRLQDENTDAIVSFSFVNTDLRDVFRSRFPNAKWILVDTDENEATKRINERKDHFYKGEKGDPKRKESKGPKAENDSDNSEWKFAPVTFDHVVLDGNDAVEENARRVAQVLSEIMDPGLN